MKKQQIYCIGIGGIGLSALAQHFLYEGYTVSGSDQTKSKITDLLEKKGIHVHIGHHPELLTKDIDTIFYTAALPDTDKELLRSRELGIPSYTYAQGLGQISKNKKTIAIAGSHGKTSTTAMIAHILREGGKDPSVIVGSLLAQGGTNFIHGASDLFVVEACEYKKSFLELHPFIAVITNIDNDHLDYYGTIENLVDAFRTFAESVPENGYIVFDATLPHMKSIVEKARAKVIDVSSLPYDFELKVPGEHMQKNARLAASVAQILGVEATKSKNILTTFSGTWRRSEYLGATKNGAMVFDDYGHHPTEIKVTLEGFKKKYSDKKIIALFQPHLYSRTKLLFQDFLHAFDSASSIYVAPIYAAREVDPGDIRSEMLVDGFVSQGKDARMFTEACMGELALSGEDTIIISLGAGEMNLVSERLVASK